MTTESESAAGERECPTRGACRCSAGFAGGIHVHPVTAVEYEADPRDCCDRCGGAKRHRAPCTPAEPSGANETDEVLLTVDEVRTYERIEDTGDTQGLAHRVNQTVLAHLAAARERVRVVEGERDALRAGVENLIRAAEFSATSSLSRDFNGRPGPADVSASSLRALLDGTR